MNDSTYQASWNIDSIASGTLVKQHFHILSVNRILNANQNSVVIILGNQHLQAAEIYSFTQGSIDASIAITNLAPQSNTFVATFVLVTDHRDLVSTSGFSGGSLNIPISQKTVFAPISQQSWVYNDQYVQLSWRNEMSLFHSGVLMSNTKNNVISLPFGPFSLTNNETMSIDPIIRPDRLPGGGGGGGSGGGGSSTGNPPSASLNLPGVSSSADTFEYGTGLTLAADVSSMGSVDPVSTTYVTMDFYGLTSGGGQTFLFQKTVTSTGTYDYTWTATPGYYTGVKMTYGGYWGQGTPSQVNQPIKIYDNIANTGSKLSPTDAASSVSVHDSQGNIAGYMVIQVEGPINAPVYSQSTPYIRLESSFVPANGTSITYIQNFTDIFMMTGNSAGTYSDNYFAQTTGGIYDGASANGSYTVLEDALYAALTVLAGEYSETVSASLSAIGVLLFNTNPYSTTQFYGNAANQLKVSINPTTPFYRSLNPLEPDWIFYVIDQIGFLDVTPSGTTSSNAILDYMEYSAYFGLHETNYLTTITGAVSEPIYIAQY